MLKEDRIRISAPVKCQDWLCCSLNSDWWMLGQGRNPVTDYFAIIFYQSVKKFVGIFVRLKYDFNWCSSAVTDIIKMAALWTLACSASL